MLKHHLHVEGPAGRPTGAVVGRISLRDHPDEPKLQVGTVAGRQVVVGRHYEDGQLGVFIPAPAVVPEPLLRELWLWNDEHGKGRLAGKRGDRVKARKFRGVNSEGLFYGATWLDGQGRRQRGLAWRDGWAEGQDVGREMGLDNPEAGLPPVAAGVDWVSPSAGKTKLLEASRWSRAWAAYVRLAGKFPENVFCVTGSYPDDPAGTWGVWVYSQPGVVLDVVGMAREAAASDVPQA